MILAVCCIVLLSVGLFLINLPSMLDQTQYNTGGNGSRAALLDGLYDTLPNPIFTETLVKNLSTAGYSVDVYRGKNVTIDLLRNINGYKILVLRLHSALHTDNSLYLFSGEEYIMSKYVDEQLTGAVSRGSTSLNGTRYFTLKAESLGSEKPNSLSGVTVIMMGCNGASSQNAIQELLQAGVKVYVSWDGVVDLSHSEKASLRLIEIMYKDGLSADAAVEAVNREVGPDPTYKSKLICAQP